MGRFNPTRGPWGRQMATRVVESYRRWNGRACAVGGGVRVLGLRHQRSNVCWSECLLPPGLPA